LAEELGEIPNGEEHKADMDEIKAVGGVEPLSLDVVYLKYQVGGDPVIS